MSEYEAAKDPVELPKRDELLIELSILLGQLGQTKAALIQKRSLPEFDENQRVISAEIYQKTINVLSRAIAYVRSSE